MYNTVRDGAAFSHSLLTANIVIIPKPNKDPHTWVNYRPISLINIDLKILTKILANRLNSFLTRLIKKDQTALSQNVKREMPSTESCNCSA